jgi:protein gp37
MIANHGMLWTDRTWPVVQGCTKVSPGCARCMAEQSLGHCRGWKKNGERPFAVVLRWDLLTSPSRAKKPYRVLVAPQGDLFHKDVPHEFLIKVLIKMRHCSSGHTYFLLTKRPERMREFFARATRAGFWPLPNVNIGVSAENQEWYDRRMPVLIDIPIHDLAYRYVVCEPLLGPIDLGIYGHHIGWLVYGQERASFRRPMDREWGDSLVRQCRELHIPFYRHRSIKPWKLQMVQQQREEEEMKIELLTEVPSNGTPSIVLDRSLLEQVQGLCINGVAIMFGPPKDGAVPEPVKEVKPAGPLSMDRSDLRRVMSEFEDRTSVAEAMDMTSTTLGRILGGKKITEVTRQKVEAFLTKHLGAPVNFKATIRGYPGQG